MQVKIKCHGIASSEELNEQVTRRIGFGLRRFGAKVVTVTVRLSDTNGPRGGQDKQCRILVKIANGSLVAIEELDADVFVAIARAAERAGRAVGRHLSRLPHDNPRAIRGTSDGSATA